VHALAEQYQDDVYQPLRADLYRLMGTLMATPPSAEVLNALQTMEIDEAATPLVTAVANLVPLAKAANVEELATIYTSLFIGVGRGELVPYASWYSSGFVMDKSLARLREDLRELGFVREEGVSEPEDHVAAICDVMSQLIDSESPVPLDRQRRFFINHLQPWLPQFFVELQSAESSDPFYRAVGQFGECLILEEKQYLENVS